MRNWHRGGVFVPKGAKKTGPLGFLPRRNLIRRSRTRFEPFFVGLCNVIFGLNERNGQLAAINEFSLLFISLGNTDLRVPTCEVGAVSYVVNNGKNIVTGSL